MLVFSELLADCQYSCSPGLAGPAFLGLPLLLQRLSIHDHIKLTAACVFFTREHESHRFRCARSVGQSIASCRVSALSKRSLCTRQWQFWMPCGRIWRKYQRLLGTQSPPLRQRGCAWLNFTMERHSSQPYTTPLGDTQQIPRLTFDADTHSRCLGGPTFVGGQSTSRTHNK